MAELPYLQSRPIPPKQGHGLNGAPDGDGFGGGESKLEWIYHFRRNARRAIGVSTHLDKAWDVAEGRTGVLANTKLLSR